jgi:hypothetical protein
MNGNIKSSLKDFNDESFRLDNEKSVKTFLETVLQAPYDYDVSAYERNVRIRQNRRRTKLAKHSYYLFTNINSGDINAVGFTAVKFALYSTGIWELNSESDLSSYQNYLNGNKKWDTAKIEIDIDVFETATNILYMLGRDTAFYYRSHLRTKPGYFNCNTALWSTLVMSASNAIGSDLMVFDLTNR